MQQLLNRMEKWLRIKATDSLLDIGSADGFILSRLYDRTPFARGVGIDLSSEAVETARAISSRGGALQFEVGSADQLAFPDASFDKVILNELIEHIPDDEKVLSEISRVLRHGGLVYLTAPNDLASMLPLFRAHCRSMDRVEGHLHRYKMSDLKARLLRHGLEVVDTEYSGFLANYFWYRYVVYNVGLKRAAMRLITRRTGKMGDVAVRNDAERPQFNLLATLPFAAMRFVSVLDSPFRNSPLNMGFHLLARKID